MQRKLIKEKIDSNISILGVIEAGFPTPSEESLIGSTTLDSYLIKNKEATFMLRVKGDSMIEAGILDGDMVIVERQTTAKVGQIIIAEIDGGFTMKYLRKNKDGYYLEPANKMLKSIYPKNDLKISAVVKVVIRKF